MMEVIGAKESRAFRVLWMLEELDAKYCHRPAKPHSPYVLEHNPTGKIPVLVTDEEGEALTESVAILQYLADRNGRFSFPISDRRRAIQDGWTHRILDEIDACIWTAAKHSFVLPEDRRVSDIKNTLRWEFARSIKRIAMDLDNSTYVMGDEMTVPDFILGHCLMWAKRARFDYNEPSIVAYFERLRARPAFRRTMEI